MDDRTLLIFDENGNEKEMEINFFFDNEQYGKTYVMFHDPKDPEAGHYLEIVDENYNMYQIEDDEEWEVISAMAEEINEAIEDVQDE